MVYSNIYGAGTETYPLGRNDSNDSSSLKVSSCYRSWDHWFNRMIFGGGAQSELTTSNGESLQYDCNVSHVASNGKVAVMQLRAKNRIVFVDLETSEIVKKWKGSIDKNCQDITNSKKIHHHYFEFMAISPDGKYLATYHRASRPLNYSGVVLMWDIDKIEVCNTFYIPLHEDGTPFRSESLGMEFSPDNSVIAYYGVDMESYWNSIYDDPDFRKRKGMLVLWDTAMPNKCTVYSDLVMPKRRNFVKVYPGFFKINVDRFLHQIDWVEQDGGYAVELQADKSVYVPGWGD